MDADFFISCLNRFSYAILICSSVIPNWATIKSTVVISFRLSRPLDLASMLARLYQSISHLRSYSYLLDCLCGDYGYFRLCNRPYGDELPFGMLGYLETIRGRQGA